MKKNLIILSVAAAGIIFLSACSFAEYSSIKKTNQQNTESVTVSEIDADNTSSVIEEAQKTIGTDELTVTVRDLSYTEKTQEPSVTVKYHDEVLKKNVDYTLQYDTKNISVGIHYATLTMQGKYQGTEKIAYKINPARVNITTTETKVSSFEVNFTESETAEGYQAEYSPNEDFSESITVQTDTTMFLAENLIENSSYYVRVRAYKKVDNQKLYSAWSEIKKCSLKEIIVKDGLTYIDGILVVNKTYSLPEDYGSGEDPEALAAFEEMCSAAANDGIYLFSVSGYRSYSLQDYLYNEFKSQRGTEGADMVSARPGHSEHQSGLAFDVNTTSFAFIGTPEAQWLAKNSYRYGFIIRYPEGKEEITGYSYEPWHIRYVGTEFADTIYKSGLTLEEYFGITSKYEE